MIHSRFELGPHLRAVATKGHSKAKRLKSPLLWSFLAAVCAPPLLVFTYLTFVAAPQFSTSFGLVIHRQEPALPPQLGISLAGVAGASSADADLLLGYLRSPAFAAALDSRQDIARSYAAPGYDPWFSLPTKASPEDIAAYLPRMIRTSLDRRSHLISVEVRAFSPSEASAIAGEVIALSQELFQSLTQAGFEALAPATRSELEDSERRLQYARGELAGFQSRTQLLDPHLDVAGQLAVLTDLQGQLVEARIDLGLLQASAQPEDARVVLAAQRLGVIEGLVKSERLALSQGVGQKPLADLLAEYERLAAAVEYAGQRYMAAQAAYDTLLSTAGRNAKLVLAYAPPETPTIATYPKTGQTTATAFVFCLLLWAATALLWAGWQDRR